MYYIIEMSISDIKSDIFNIFIKLLIKTVYINILK